MDDSTRPIALGVLTSGGDAQGMNAAVRAVVRTALREGITPYIIHEGYLGMTDGGPAIQQATSGMVGGILHRGGTTIGTARSDAFRTLEGRQRAAANLVERGIDALVVIGGDGSLTGANIFREEWPDHLEALVADGKLDREVADRHPHLRLVGMVGSIDNDMFGTDMTIGADSALHRITEAIDSLRSTASSHQRSFVIEVMGRNCGYLALMSALATGANWVFIPEHPPQVDDWRETLKRTVEAGRAIGRRQNLVIVAEGARDLQGEPITSEQVRETLADGLGEDTRITILGHVQRGGAPSAFDRNLGTQCGYHAVHELLRLDPDADPVLVGIRENRIQTSPLMDAIARTHAVAEHLEEGEFDEAMELRGGSFAEAYQTMRTLVRAQPRAAEGERSRRFLVLHAGAPSPGMNTAVRAAVRIAMDVGHTVLGAQGGFPGLIKDDVEVLDWMSVSGWVADGGAELGTSRSMPEGDDIARVAERLVEHEIDGVLLIGGFDGYEAAYRLHLARERYPALKLPIVCLPATISNDVPGTELSIGADTALNSIVLDVDKIKQSAVADKRCFIVEVMGKDSGYLALNAGMATGAERIYTPETGIDLDRLQSDVAELRAEFQAGQRLGLIIKGEHADPVYTTPFLWALFSKEGNGDFDVRQSILGHLQQGGDPSPFDRIQATRLAARCVEFLQEQAAESAPESAMSGLVAGKVTFTPLTRFWDLLDGTARRAAHRPWKSLRPIADAMSMPPGT